MVTAAEILRYTSTNTEELEWTAKDTADFTAHLIHPVIDLPASQRLLYEPASVHRWDYYGDSRDIHVRRSVLWADVDHPINIGTHGSYERDGDIIENIRFEDLDILEHHEPQPDYWGCIAINPGDKNTVRKIRFENIRIEPFELGEPFNIRVKYNPKYNPAPGSRIEDILFKDITCDGKCPNPSRIEGYDDNRVVDGITFENVTIDGVRMTAGSGHLQVRDHVRNLTVR